MWRRVRYLTDNGGEGEILAAVGSTLHLELPRGDGGAVSGELDVGRGGGAEDGSGGQPAAGVGGSGRGGEADGEVEVRQGGGSKRGAARSRGRH